MMELVYERHRASLKNHNITQHLENLCFKLFEKFIEEICVLLLEESVRVDQQKRKRTLIMQ